MWSEGFPWDFIQTWRMMCEGMSFLSPCQVGGHSRARSRFTINGSVRLEHRTLELVPLEAHVSMGLCNLLLNYTSVSRVSHSNFLPSRFPQGLYYANMRYGLYKIYAYTV